jgi:hypothetical protein
MTLVGYYQLFGGIIIAIGNIGQMYKMCIKFYFSFIMHVVYLKPMHLYIEVLYFSFSLPIQFVQFFHL